MAQKYTNKDRYTTTANTDIHTRKFEDTNTCASTVLVETFFSHRIQIVLVFLVLHMYTNYSSLINDKDTEFASIPHRSCKTKQQAMSRSQMIVEAEDNRGIPCDQWARQTDKFEQTKDIGRDYITLF